MNIYIKTNMKEMPKECEQCCMLLEAHNERNYLFCGAKGYGTGNLDFGHIELPIKRPDWCPLITKQQILEGKE